MLRIAALVLLFLTVGTAYSHHKLQSHTLYWGFPADDWTALFTLGLFIVGLITAVFLLIQLCYLRQSVRDVGKQIDNSVAINLPIVVLDEMRLIDPDTRKPIEGIPPESSTFTIAFRNYGKMPAGVAQIFAQHLVVRELPPIPRYTVGGDVRAGIVIKANGGDFQHDPMLVIALSEAERSDIARNIEHLWIYGFINFRDFRGDLHEQRFCERWVCGEHDNMSGFVEAGPEGYHKPPKTDFRRV